MNRFMICDVDIGFLDKLASVLHDQFDPCSVEYVCGPSALEVALREDAGCTGVLITEIELRDQNAIDIISAHQKSYSALQVIYMTSKIEYCMDVYQTQHCGFLVKPIQQQYLFAGIQRALSLLERKKTHGIAIQKGGSIHIVDEASLLYIESHARVIRIITDAEVLEMYSTIEQFSCRLDKRFIQCHKSYAVNIERVKQFRGDSFLMENNAVVPISQSKRKEVRRRFLEYVGIEFSL